MEAKKAKVISCKIYPARAEFDIYTSEGINDSAENDAITSAEEGFMVGYLGA